MMLFFFSLFIDSYCLISDVTTHLFNPIVKLVIPIGIPTKKAKAEIAILPVGSVQYSLESCKFFCACYSSIYFALFLKQNFLFHLYF